MSRTEEGFERLGPPRRGEWRSIFHEPEQTFEAYAARCANRRTEARSLLLLQPLGEIAAPLDRMREYAEAFFGLETRVRPPLPAVERAHISARGQSNSSMILDELIAPADALLTIGVTDRDLFARGKKFVFGEGRFERRTGVISLARLEGSERRALKLLSHEAGHILSIAHCTTHRCVMQGSNGLEESDRHPLYLCPEDLRKLEWNTGADRQERYRRLRAFYEKAGWAEDAAWTAERIQKAVYSEPPVRDNRRTAGAPQVG